ncbi:MAG: 16S rRNA processing protein RimM [Oscillibacter sp.]|nr:16S rRNA processing protein RimM [Oscillibacter sp.]
MYLERILVGQVVNAHGIRGEVRVQPRDGDPAFLTRFRTFYVDGKAVTPNANHVHKGMALMKFPGVEDMNAALAWKGKELYIAREDARLPEGEYFDDELLGLSVYDGATGALLGELTAVESYPASKVYTVRGQRTYLVPAVKGAFIQSVDLAQNRMEIRVWEGLADDEH